MEFTMFHLFPASKLLLFVDRGAIVSSMKKLKKEVSQLQPKQGAIKGSILHDNCMEFLL
jgi:hypothetical protein